MLRLLKEVEEINTRPLISLIEGARAGLFTFLRELEKKLERVPIRWRIIEGSRRAVCDALARCWYWGERAGHSSQSMRRYLGALINLSHSRRRVENFSEVQEQVYGALSEVVRASSAVECINSILRPFVSVKKHLSQEFLALVALYWDMHRLKERGGRTPFEASGVDLGNEDWVEVLEREMRRMAAEPARAA